MRKGQLSLVLSRDLPPFHHYCELLGLRSPHARTQTRMPPSLLVPLRADLAHWSSASARSVSLEHSDTAYGQLPPYARARFVHSNGVLWKAEARCVYRRDEVTAWALLQMLDRYPGFPDFDVVLNCRDGPLLRRTKHIVRAAGVGQPLVLTYSTTAAHAEIAFPDYTLWGLPGKLKPWVQLRLDLLHRAQRPWARRIPRAFSTAIINDYHNTVGVKARIAVQKCADRKPADPRLEIHYHRQYFERFYSTEEHCQYKYILMAPGSMAVWLDHLKHKLLCGSLVMVLEPSSDDGLYDGQYDVLTRLLERGVHYLSVPLPSFEAPANSPNAKGRAHQMPHAHRPPLSHQHRYNARINTPATSRQHTLAPAHASPRRQPVPGPAHASTSISHTTASRHLIIPPHHANASCQRQLTRSTAYQMRSVRSGQSDGVAKQRLQSDGTPKKRVAPTAIG